MFYDDYNSLTFFLTKNPSVGGPRHSLITIYRHLSNGKIVKTGDKNLAIELEKKGYEGLV